MNISMMSTNVVTIILKLTPPDTFMLTTTVILSDTPATLNILYSEINSRCQLMHLPLHTLD